MSSVSSRTTRSSSGSMTSSPRGPPTEIREPSPSPSAGNRQTSATSPRKFSSVIASMPAMPAGALDAVDSVRLASCRNCRLAAWRRSARWAR